MKNSRLILILALIIASAFQAPAQTANAVPVVVQTNSEQEFKKLLQENADARLRGDNSVAERTLGDTLTATDEKGKTEILTKADALKRISPASAAFFAALKLTSKIEDVKVQTLGDTAIVNYRDETHLIINDEPVVKNFRNTDVFKRAANGSWQLFATQQTVIPGEPFAAKVDPKIYDAYAGQYQLMPKIIFNVRRDGNKLMLNTRELVPENENTFIDKSNFYRIIFVRDDKGQITHFRIREFPGVEYNAIKIK